MSGSHAVPELDALKRRILGGELIMVGGRAFEIGRLIPSIRKPSPALGEEFQADIAAIQPQSRISHSIRFS
jgi:hypothetical protein